ncbi:hypothetical protein [Stagnihabitans tardus]|uniref:Uncharacterized protein n=1 Tax=Stagnihabitans tardus TaxID=2699202 RepID=A0AAE5BWH1_9RHOB|nr:hypothetical protein [Stagnihabitans tardus]NBZ88293.1 hypothetical protein [Stagnihabitans tardus]
MKKERRWLKSAIAAANEPQVALPWARGSRRRPASMMPAVSQPAPTPVSQPQAVAAR